MGRWCFFQLHAGFSTPFHVLQAKHSGYMEGMDVFWIIWELHMEVYFSH